MTFGTRPGSLTDAPSVGRIHVASWRAAYRGIVPDADLAALDVDLCTERWRQILQEQSSSFRVVENATGVVGWSSFGPARTPHPSTEGEIYGFYLDPSAWGTGAARVLMESTLESLGPSWTQLRLEVLRDNVRARRFYEKFAWRPEGTEDVWVSQDGLEIPTVEYVRPVW